MRSAGAAKQRNDPYIIVGAKGAFGHNIVKIGENTLVKGYEQKKKGHGV